MVGGRYELGELLGYGGMAEVHRGRDVRLGREVAIKILRVDLARDDSFLKRFRREAQAAAGLNHPSIVSVFDTGDQDAPDGTTQPYIVMEYVEGRTLRDILRTEGHLPVRRAMEITADVCGALDFSHRNGIVHRDIKPANVMITNAGAVKVMDFGIARAVADNSATVTQTANVIGTAQYLSPEQARGETVDARSDVYSTGCLLYELVTGVPPFQGDSPVAVAYQHVRENPVPPSARNADLPPAVDSIVMKALAKNQLNRYQSAGDMRGDLQRALANQPVTAEAVMTDAERTQFIARTPPIPPQLTRQEEQPEPEPEHRYGLIWLAIALALLVVAAGVAALVYFTRNDDSGGAKKVALPDVTGYVESAAVSALRNDGFTNLHKGEDTSGQCDGGQTVTKGQVCTLEPAPGTEVKTDSPVTYHLYTPATVTVPSVIGEQYAAAAKTLHDAGLSPKRKVVNNSEAAGKVISQDPGQYQAVSPGTTVVLSVSTGKVELPDVRGMTLDKAKERLNAAGFTTIPKPATQKGHDQSKDGQVVDESPTVGNAYPLSTTINLTVYQYIKVVQLPDVRGMTQDKAVAQLRGAGFTNISATEQRGPDQSKDGTVVAEDPKPGGSYPPSTAVTLTVYKYVAPLPTCQPGQQPGNPPVCQEPSGPTGTPTS
jgi:serine/threonine-protein kinase